MSHHYEVKFTMALALYFLKQGDNLYPKTLIVSHSISQIHNQHIFTLSNRLVAELLTATLTIFRKSSTIIKKASIILKSASTIVKSEKGNGTNIVMVRSLFKLTLLDCLFSCQLLRSSYLYLCIVYLPDETPY